METWLIEIITILAGLGSKLFGVWRFVKSMFQTSENPEVVTLEQE